MWTAGVAFGQRVAMLHRRAPAAVVPLRLLAPGDGGDLRSRAATARDRSTPFRDGRHREVVIPGRPCWAERVRREWRGADPLDVDAGARARLWGADHFQTHRYAVLGEWGSWRQRMAGLAGGVDASTPFAGSGTFDGSGTPDIAPLPIAELSAALADRPDLRDEPTGGEIPRGLGSLRSQVLLDSLAGRAALIAALQGEQYADAALLAESYPHDQEFLAVEVSLALQVPQSEAAALVCTAVSLATKLPATLAAARAGQISAEAARIIVGATAAVTDPDTAAAVERSVLPHTRWKTRERLRRLVVREVIRHDPDGADRRHVAARKDRTVSTWSDVDGMGWLKVYAAAADIAAVWESLTGLGQAAKTPGCTTTLDQRRADALCDVFHSILDSGGFGAAELPAQHGRKPHIGVLVPADLLHPAGGVGPSARAMRGVCEMAGYGPVAPMQALHLAAEGLWRRLVCDPLSGRLLDYGRTRYEPPAALKQFIVTRDQRCQLPGCSLPSWRAQIDHVEPYSAGGLTDEVNLISLCHHHHRAKDGGGFTLRVDSDRSRTWITPLGRRVTVPEEPLLEVVERPIPVDQRTRVEAGTLSGREQRGAGPAAPPF